MEHYSFCLCAFCISLYYFSIGINWQVHKSKIVPLSSSFSKTNWYFRTSQIFTIMLLSYTVFILLILLGFVGFIVLLAWVWRLMGRKSEIGGLIGFLVGIIGSMIVWGEAQRVYIVKGEKNYSRYVLYGKKDYKMSNGTPLKLITGDSGLLVNDYDQPLEIVKVFYGKFAFPEVTKVKAYRVNRIGESSVDHFFDDEPPKSVSSSSEEAARIWVRRMK